MNQDFIICYRYFFVVIFLFPCDIVVICPCPTYRVMTVLSADQHIGKIEELNRYDPRSSSSGGSLYLLQLKVLWRWCIDKYRRKGKVEWMVCHSDCQYLYHSLLPAIINFLIQSDDNFCHHLRQKNLDVPFQQIYQYLKLYLLPVLYCTTTVVLHYLAPQCQSVKTGAVLMKYCLSLCVHKMLKQY